MVNLYATYLKLSDFFVTLQAISSFTDMKRTAFLLLLGIFATINVSAQITIGGHKPFYDQPSQSLLFIVDSILMNDYSAIIVADADSAWQDLKINEEDVTNSNFHFGNVSNDKTFSLSATSNGKKLIRIVRFTCLPVIGVKKGTAFSNDYENATLTVDGPDGSFISTELACKIKYRGGTTNAADRHKRNYKFKVLNDKGKSLDMSFFEMRKDNGWILDAGQVDLFRMRNKLCHKLWLDFSTKPYYFSEEPEAVNGCHAKEIELFVNNEYRGMYSLMEPVDRKQLKLKKYKSEDGVHGLLFKTDNWEGTSFWNGFYKEYSNACSTWGGWEAKYPEPGDDADTTDYAPLNDFIDFVASSTDQDFKKEIANRVDVPVIRDYSLFVQIIGGFDNIGKNIYWSVYNKTKKKYSKFVPTPWDMDATFGQFYHNGLYEGEDSSWVDPKHSYTPFNGIDYRLKNVYGEEYTDSMETRYAALRKTWFSYDSLLKRFKDAYDEMKYSGAMSREEAKWSGDTDLGGLELNFKKQLSYIENWIRLRLMYLDGVYHYYNSTGISNVHNNSDKDFGNGNFYNLQGQKVSTSYRGIVIMNGRKFYNR